MQSGGTAPFVARIKRAPVRLVGPDQLGKAYSRRSGKSAPHNLFSSTAALYKGAKPVMWSVVERTALAEAEIEYQDYTSDTIYVKFPVKNWTTRPDANATLPSNPAAQRAFLAEWTRGRSKISLDELNSILPQHERISAGQIEELLRK